MLPHNFPGKKKEHIYFTRLTKNNDIICLSEIHGREEFLQATVTRPDFTRKDSTADGTIHSLSRIDRTFINLPMAEARDLHCFSHVFEIFFGERSIPSDHAAVRVVIQKPTLRGHQGKRIPSWMSKHSVFCSFLKRFDDDHQYSADPFGALADFKIIIEKARRRTVRELLRKTPDSLGAKLLTASTAIRAYRNRHLGTLMRCCEAWEPVGKCFDHELLRVHRL